MKRIMFFTLVSLSVIAAQAALTSPFAGNAPQAGTPYYLYNVKAKAFVGNGGEYETRLAISVNEFKVTLEATGDASQYYIQCSVNSPSDANNHYFCPQSEWSGYTVQIDAYKNEGGPLTVVQAEGEAEGFYTISTSDYGGTRYLYQSGNDVLHGESPEEGSQYWQFITYEDLVAHAADVKATNPEDFSVLLPCNSFYPYDTAFGSWSGSPATGGKSHDYYAKDASFCVEKDCPGGEAFDVYQTITVPNGMYAITYQGFYQDGSNFADAVAKHNAGTEELSASFYANDVLQPMTSIVRDATLMQKLYETATIDGVEYYYPSASNIAAEAFDEGLYQSDPLMVRVTDGTLRIGFKKAESADGSWACWDNVRLTYYGNSDYVITKPNDFVEFAKATKTDGTLNAVLLADLDMTDITWTPIGTEENPYIGTFDGNMHTIDNLVINLPSQRFVGLFGVLGEDVHICNLVLGPGSSVYGEYFVGGIAGGTTENSNGKVYLTNVGNEAAVTAMAQNAAGLIATSAGGNCAFQLKNCYNTGTISGSNESAALSAWLGHYGSIVNCYNTGTVTGIQSSSRYLYRSPGGETVSNLFSTVGDQGTKVGDADVTSGKLAYMLNGYTDNGTDFYQTIGTDNHPVPFSTHGHVWRWTRNEFNNVEPEVPYVPGGQCGDDLTWAWDSQTNKLTISGTGDMWDYTVDSQEISPWQADGIASQIKTVVIDDRVTSIGAAAFYGCEAFTSITIPSGVTSIGHDAFNGCRRLAAISIPSGVTSIEDCVFHDCSGLKSVTIPDNVTSIGREAFCNCNALTSLTIPEKVTSIGAGAFSSCSGITTLTIPDGVTSISENTFYCCYGLTSLTLPANLTSIGSEAFNECYNLTSLTIPDKVTSIGSYAFEYCYGLATLTIPDKVTSIGPGAFYYCSDLTSLTIPDGVTSIGEYTFYRCSGLTSLILPANLTSIGSSAFSNCNGLTTLTLPPSLTSIGSYAFYYCNGLTTLTIPKGVTSIGESAFDNCSNLTSLSLPENMTKIGSYTFYNCCNLTSLIIPEKVTSIGSYAFGWCSGLTSITIPENVTEIGYYAFYRCANLASITVHPTTPPYLGSYVFNGLPENGVLTQTTGADYSAWLNYLPSGWSIIRTGVSYRTSAESPWHSLTMTDGVLPISDTFYAFEVGNEMEVPTVTYSRTFGTDKWQSLYLPFDMKVADFEGKFDVAYVNNFVQYDRNNDGAVDDSYIEIIPVTTGYIYANRPYFIRAKQTSASPQVMTFHNVTLKPTADCKTSHVESAVSEALFAGTYDPIDKTVVVDEKLFLVSGGDFKWLNQNVKCFRTYMKITSKDPMFYLDPNSTIGIRTYGEDDATNVNVLEYENEGIVVYDLQGRKVDNPQSGIYIVNGKKTLFE